MPVPSEVRVLVAILVAGAFAMFLPLLVCAALYAVRAKSARRRSVDRSPMPRHVPEPAAVTRGRNTRQAAVALALVILAAAVGCALAR